MHDVCMVGCYDWSNMCKSCCDWAKLQRLCRIHRDWFSLHEFLQSQLPVEAAMCRGLRPDVLITGQHEQFVLYVIIIDINQSLQEAAMLRSQQFLHKVNSLL